MLIYNTHVCMHLPHSLLLALFVCFCSTVLLGPTATGVLKSLKCVAVGPSNKVTETSQHDTLSSSHPDSVSMSRRCPRVTVRAALQPSPPPRNPHSGHGSRAMNLFGILALLLDDYSILSYESHPMHSVCVPHCVLLFHASIIARTAARSSLFYVRGTATNVTKVYV